MITENNVKNYYEQFTESHILHDRLSYNRRYIYIRKILKRFIKPRMKVLELGCGTGITSEYILKLKAEVTGIDLSENNITFAQQLIKRGVFIAHDVLTLDLKQAYDVITLFDFMEHIPRQHHEKLFSIIKAHSHEETLILINIPSARATAYTRKVQPELLQIVDEEISIQDMFLLCELNGMYIQKYIVNDVFKNQDYDEIIIKYKHPVNVVPVYENRLHFVFRKILWKIRNARLKNKYKKIILNNKITLTNNT